MEKTFRLRMNLLTRIGEPTDGMSRCAIGGREIGSIPNELLKFCGYEASLWTSLFRIVGSEQDGMVPCELVADDTPLQIPAEELVEFKVGTDPMIEGR
jgi:hypothetical protein